MSSYYRITGASREIYTNARLGLEAVTVIAAIAVTALVFAKPHLDHPWGRWAKTGAAFFTFGRICSLIYWAILICVQYGAVNLDDETAILNGSYAMIGLDVLFSPTAAVVTFLAVMGLSSHLHGRHGKLIRTTGLVLALLLEITILANWGVSIAVSARTTQAAGQSYSIAEYGRVTRELNDLTSKQIRTAWAMDIMDVIVMLVGVVQSLFVLFRRKAANDKSPAILCVVASLLLLLRATYGLGQTAQNWNPLTGKYWGPRQASYASYVLGIILGAWPLLAAIVCLFAAGKRLLGVAHGHSGAA